MVNTAIQGMSICSFILHQHALSLWLSRLSHPEKMNAYTAYVGLHKFSQCCQPSVVQNNKTAWDGQGYGKNGNSNSEP